jgi:hypothetical protein
MRDKEDHNHQIPNTNYVAFISSVMHQISFNACYIQKREDGKLNNGVIVIYPSPTGEIIIHENNFVSLCPNTMKVHYASNQKTNFNYLMDKGKITNYNSQEFYVFFTEWKLININLIKQIECELPNCQVKIIILEEGIGTYIRNVYYYYQKVWHTKKGAKRYKELLGTFINYSIQYQYVKTLKKQGRLLMYTLFLENKGKLILNNEVIPYYKRVFEKQSEKLIRLNRNYYENAFVINTQPLFEDENVMELDQTVWKELADLLRSKGFRVIIKPHPREKQISRYEMLGVEIDKYPSIAQETLLSEANIKPLAIFGFFSTVLLTAKLLWNIRTVSVSDCIEKERLPKFYQKDMINFNKKFGAYVEILNQIKDFVI